MKEFVEKNGEKRLKTVFADCGLTARDREYQEVVEWGDSKLFDIEDFCSTEMRWLETLKTV